MLDHATIPRFEVENIAQAIIAAFMRRHKKLNVIIEEGRKIVGTNARPGYRNVRGVLKGMKIEDEDGRLYCCGSFCGSLMDGSGRYESGRVALNLNSRPESGEERCFLANASSSLVCLFSAR